MRFLIYLVAVSAALWSGYWFVGSTAKHSVIEAWFEERRLAGWTAGYSSFDVVGFPNRFDSRFVDLELADKRTGWSWSAPLFNILALSYQPNHIIAVWPHTQVIGFPLEDVTINSTEMRASVVFEANTSLALERTALRTSALKIFGGSGWSTSAQSLSFSTRQSVNNDLAHDIVFEVVNLTPTKLFKNSIDPANTLPAVITRLLVDTEIVYDVPWDRIAVENGLPLAQRIILNDVSTVWGDLGLKADGALDVGSDGLLSGKVSLDIKNWRGVLALGVSSGLFNATLADRLETGLSLLTSLSDNPQNLKAPLTFADGQISLGPIPLGPGPRLSPRRR